MNICCSAKLFKLFCKNFCYSYSWVRWDLFWQHIILLLLCFQFLSFYTTLTVFWLPFSFLAVESYNTVQFFYSLFNSFGVADRKGEDALLGYVPYCSSSLTCDLLLKVWYRVEEMSEYVRKGIRIPETFEKAKEAVDEIQRQYKKMVLIFLKVLCSFQLSFFTVCRICRAEF